MTDREHPDDRAARLRSESVAAVAIERFCAEHAAELRALIQTYAESSAERRLAELREQFWSNLPAGAP